jgi:drug/metabolite transporter (DMT)-like permease
LALLGLGWLVQVLAWWLIAWSFGHISASLGSLGLLFQQVATVLLGWLLLKETPGMVQGLGILFILAGIALAATHPPVPNRR